MSQETREAIAQALGCNDFVRDESERAQDLEQYFTEILGIEFLFYDAENIQSPDGVEYKQHIQMYITDAFYRKGPVWRIDISGYIALLIQEKTGIKCWPM